MLLANLIEYLILNLCAASSSTTTRELRHIEEIGSLVFSPPFILLPHHGVYPSLYVRRRDQRCRGMARGFYFRALYDRILESYHRLAQGMIYSLQSNEFVINLLFFTSY